LQYQKQFYKYLSILITLLNLFLILQFYQQAIY